MDNKSFFLTDDQKWVDLGDGVLRQILGYNDQLMMVKVKFDKGAIGSLHGHPHSQTTYCAGGVFEFVIGAEKKVIREGDSLFINPDIQHSALCLEEGILIDVFNPLRKDFLM
jgi:quercetin dioxygenase-like cupin family protein